MSDTSRRLGGLTFLSVDGESFLVAGEPKYQVASFTRETKTGLSGVDGYTETPIAGYISASLRDTGTVTVADFNAMTNVTVLLQLANGKTVTARNAWTTGVQEVDSAEATFEVRWDSQFVEEI